MKRRLFTPGPTPVPEEVALAMSQPIIHHRQADFKETFRRVSENLKYVFQTKEDVLTLTASGTGAMEAAVANLLSSNDTSLYVDGGKFGERWGQILQRFGVSSSTIKVEWGTAVSPELIGEALSKHPKAKAVFLTQSETSTGTVTDVQRVAEVVKSCSQALIVVDGISSIGALEMKMDEWGIDVTLTASQKGLMLPPGLAFIALSQRAWEAARSSNLPKFYFDLQKARKTLKEAQTPWTPAISLILGLDVALQMIRREDLRNVWARHERLGRGLRKGSSTLGLETFSKCPSNSLTALNVPSGIDGEALRAQLRGRHGIIVAGGQDHLKGRIIRVAHLGYFNDEDIVAVVSALGMSVHECLAPSGKDQEAVPELRDRFDVGASVDTVLKEFRQGTKQEFQLTYP